MRKRNKLFWICFFICVREYFKNIFIGHEHCVLDANGCFMCALFVNRHWSWHAKRDCDIALIVGEHGFARNWEIFDSWYCVTDNFYFQLFVLFLCIVKDLLYYFLHIHLRKCRICDADSPSYVHLFHRFCILFLIRLIAFESLCFFIFLIMDELCSRTSLMRVYYFRRLFYLSTLFLSFFVFSFVNLLYRNLLPIL